MGDKSAISWKRPRRLRRYTPAPIDRGRESRIEGLTLVDLPRVFLPSLRVRDRYYVDVVRRAVHPENREA